MYKHVIFDLDGTLLESLNDIKNALNISFREMNIPVSYTYDEAKPFIGSGIYVTIDRAIASLNLDEETKNKYKELVVKNYEVEQGKTTKPFNDEVEALKHLKESGVSLYVLTNKPQHLAEQIISKTYGKDFFKEILGEHPSRKLKPSPITIFEMMNKYHIKRNEVIYVGDTDVDVLTAKNAGIDSLLVTFGYGNYTKQLLQSATYIADSIEVMKDILLTKSNEKLYDYELEDHEWPFKGVTHTREIARAVLLDENDNVCLEYILDDDGFGHRDYYETPGGGMKEGESFQDSLLRECSEEVGYECEILAHLADVKDYYNLIYRENHNHYFLARRTKKTLIHQEPDEVQRVKGIIWVSIDEAISLYENMQDELVGKLVKERELPILRLAKSALQIVKK